MKILSLKLFLFILLFITLSFNGVQAKAIKYVTLAPSITEILYAINAQDNLIAGVSWSSKVKIDKPNIGDSFYINSEAIIKYHPDIIFALDCQRPMVDGLKITGAKIYYFSFTSINSIYDCISLTSKLTNHKANGDALIKKLQNEIHKSKTVAGKRFLFVAQAEPLISVGCKSFISDIIKQSGHTNILENIKSDYPRISLEYVISKKPDIIVVSDSRTKDYLRKYLKGKYVVLKPDENDIINRPGPRINDAVKIFAGL